MDEQNEYGETMLIASAKKGYMKLVELCISDQADENIQDILGYTALMWAVENEHNDIVNILLNEKVLDRTLKNKKGETALMIAKRVKDKKLENDFNRIAFNRRSVISLEE